MENASNIVAVVAMFDALAALALSLYSARQRRR